MKLIRCDGHTLDVWDIPAPPVLRLIAGPAPIKAHGWHMLEDNVARELVKSLLSAGAIRGEVVK